MTLIKKVILILIAICLFIAVTVGFTVMLCGGDVFGFLRQEQQAPDALDYPRSLTEPVWTEETQLPETQPTETQPPETEAPTEETLPPETQIVETEPPMTFDTVPVYDMSQYADIRYLSGSIATSGSNVTSLAMVASYMTKHEYTPAMLMEYFGNYIGNSFEWLDYVSDQLQLPWKKAENFHVAKQALREGKVVIVLLGEKSIFTQSQHFIVLAGLNEAGKIVVNDPYEPHYTQWNLEKGLAEGFEDIVTATVTTKTLGMPRLTEELYENADGTPLAITTDFFGNARGERPTAGPIEGLKAGTQKILLLKK